MKPIPVSDIGTLKNELRKYKAGKKLDINQFNQVARLAWLGKITAEPFEPNDPECRSMLVYIDYPDEFIQHFVSIDQDLIGHIHLVDGEQAQALAKVLQQGVQERAAMYDHLNRRDFYFQHFFDHGEKTETKE